MARAFEIHGEREARPLLLLFLTFLLVGGLLILSGILEEDDPPPAQARSPDASGGGRGGGGAGIFVPGAPVGGYEGGSPLPDGGPAVTIIQDVRETMRRLPLDRNNPETYDPRPRPKPR
jgi:hypothetical protein